jgi:hypothetical protein
MGKAAQMLSTMTETFFDFFDLAVKNSVGQE